MANLYEIKAEIMNCIDEETGEILDEEKLNALDMERTEKIESIGLWIKNLKAEAESYKAEKKAFYEREQKATNKAASLQKYLESALNGEKFETTKLRIAYRKSTQVDCADISAVPEEYLKFKAPELDKTAIKEAIKAGKETGCTLVEKNNMQIK